MQERRNEVRDLCSELVELSWEDRFGWNHRAQGVLEDISKVGACVQTESTVPLGVDVSFRMQATEFAGTIRYCTLIAGGYYVGMEFSEGQVWEPEVSGPRYLLRVGGEGRQSATLE